MTQLAAIVSKPSNGLDMIFMLKIMSRSKDPMSYPAM